MNKPARNADFVCGLGADEVIDYITVAFDEVVKDVDVVFDIVGGETQQRVFKTQKKGGTLVTIIAQP